jgi:hypothetical protein
MNCLWLSKEEYCGRRHHWKILASSRSKAVSPLVPNTRGPPAIRDKNFIWLSNGGRTTAIITLGILVAASCYRVYERILSSTTGFGLTYTSKYTLDIDIDPVDLTNVGQAQDVKRVFASICQTETRCGRENSTTRSSENSQVWATNDDQNADTVSFRHQHVCLLRTLESAGSGCAFGVKNGRSFSPKAAHVSHKTSRASYPRRNFIISNALIEEKWAKNIPTEPLSPLLH